MVQSRHSWEGHSQTGIGGRGESAVMGGRGAIRGVGGAAIRGPSWVEADEGSGAEGKGTGLAVGVDLSHSVQALSGVPGTWGTAEGQNLANSE